MKSAKLLVAGVLALGIAGSVLADSRVAIGINVPGASVYYSDGARSSHHDHHPGHGLTPYRHHGPVFAPPVYEAPVPVYVAPPVIYPQVVRQSPLVTYIQQPKTVAEELAEQCIPGNRVSRVCQGQICVECSNP